VKSYSHAGNPRIVDSKVDMKKCLPAFAALLCTLAASGQALLSPRFKTVYILSMSNSMDEYLASRLTSSRVLWVVHQASSADTVLTDTLNENFWTWLERSYGPAGATPADAADMGYNRGSSLLNRHSGTIFLVDPRRKVVLWSNFALPKNSSPDELDRTAARIANQLKSAFVSK
jgi:hypothetical protein